MVCLGNICRSPMAQGVLEHMVEQHKLPWEVDSAGTGSWHIGELPDKRAIQTCLANGIDITGQRARQFRQEDFENFDLILTMDGSNYRDVVAKAQNARHTSKVRPILQYLEHPIDEVPDPYFDGRFQDVYELIVKSCDRLIQAETSKATESGT